MRKMQVRDAKAGFSAVIDAAEQGEPTTITRHGLAAAVVVPVEVAQRLYPDVPQDFVEFLMSFPEGTEFERDESPMRPTDL